jgi:tetratricopeptide (TPR) repeat protein
MSRISNWVTAVVAIVCLAAGFLLANLLNRSELNSLRAENERMRSNQATSTQAVEDATLSSEEIDAKLRDSEQNASNFGFQKSLGLGLYRYGAIKKDKEIIQKAIPVLERANGLDANDFDVLVGLGNAYFDVGFFGKDNPSFEKSREFYSKALAAKPADIEVRTDLGLTYFLQQPSDHAAALIEFEKSLAINPKHEKTLQFAIQSLKTQGKDAGKYIEQLRAINPNNPTLAEIASQPSVPGVQQ